MFVLIDGVRYRHITPDTEESLEKAIKSNHQHIFGPDSFYFDVKRKIRSSSGIASIPDSYVVFFDPNPKWCIVEVELASHSIYNHLIPQLTKFNRGIDDSATRKKLLDMFYTKIKDDKVLKAKLKQKIRSGEIYKFVSDLISGDPLIIIAIDERTDELEEALKDIRGNVRVLEFKTFCREGVSDQINAYVFNAIVRPKREKSETVTTKQLPTGRITKPSRQDFIKKKPKSFTFRGETVDVTNWQNILINICETFVNDSLGFFGVDMGIFSKTVQYIKERLGKSYASIRPSD